MDIDKRLLNFEHTKAKCFRTDTDDITDTDERLNSLNLPANQWCVGRYYILLGSLKCFFAGYPEREGPHKKLLRSQTMRMRYIY